LASSDIEFIGQRSRDGGGDMKSTFVRLGAVSVFALVVAACGGGGGGETTPVPPPADGSLKSAIATAATVAANDTSTNPSASFTVLQGAGMPAVVVKGAPKVNFTVFSDRAVLGTLKLTNMSLAIAKLVPGVNGEIDQWVNYVYRTETSAAGKGPGGVPVLASALQATTDPKPAALAATQLVFNPDGYYTYTFSTDVTDPTKTSGVVFEPGLTHRVAIQLSYTNAAGEAVIVNPNFDFTIDANGNSVPVIDPTLTRKMVDVGSCNGCHAKLALHGGGRVDTQYCVMCHNPGTTDANSGHKVTFMTMVHKIHAGRYLKTAVGGENYTIWGFNNTAYDFSEVGFPQDLRNCATCHSGQNPATPQGDNWKTRATKEACLTCHASGIGSLWETAHKPVAEGLVGVGAAALDLPNLQCATCHKPGSAIASERVHWSQVQQNGARYKMNIESVVFNDTPTKTGRSVTVKYFLSDPTTGNAAYNLAEARFASLQLRVAYQNLVGQPTWETEFTAYNNGGTGAVVAANTGTNDGSNHYTANIPLADDTLTAAAAGTARVVSIGPVVEARVEPKSATDPRPAAIPASNVNVVVQHASAEFAISGALKPRRNIVSTEKCNVCHGGLGTASGSNTLANAFHGGGRTTVEACVVCHDPNRMSATAMTNGLTLQESYQFKRLIHGIHGNGKRTYPFTAGNRVAAQFDDTGLQLTDGIFLGNYSVTIGGTSTVVVPAGTPSLTGSTFTSIAKYIDDQARLAGYTGAPIAAAANFAEEVLWPGMGTVLNGGLNARNCNACHVEDSYKVDRGPIGAVVSKLSVPANVSSAALTDPKAWWVITPKAASCTACHDSSKAIAHVTSWGGAAFGNKAQSASWLTQETCGDCHSSGGFKAVDIVHGLR